MSRQELAEAVNAHLFATTGRVARMDANHVGKLEQGSIRWPNADYRQGLRAVLGAAKDADLGFYITRRSASVDEYADGYPDQADPARQATGNLDAAAPSGLDAAEVRVIVSPGVALAVVRAEGGAAGLAVLAGSVRVLIEPAGLGPAAAVADDLVPPSPEGARVYSLRRARRR